MPISVCKARKSLGSKAAVVTILTAYASFVCLCVAARTMANAPLPSCSEERERERGCGVRHDHATGKQTSQSILRRDETYLLAKCVIVFKGIRQYPSLAFLDANQLGRVIFFG